MDNNALDRLESLSDKLRNISRIMAGGDGTDRIDTPAWKRVAELADELATIRASIAQQQGEALSPPQYDGSHVGIEERPDLWPEWVHRVVESVTPAADGREPVSGPVAWVYSYKGHYDIGARYLTFKDPAEMSNADMLQSNPLFTHPAAVDEAVPYRIWSIGGNEDGTATLSAVSEWHFFSERPFNTGETVYVTRAALQPATSDGENNGHR